MLNQFVEYTRVENTVVSTLGGGQPGKKIKDPKASGSMLGSCWHYFSLLGAPGTLFARLAVLVVALGLFLCVLGGSGLDFGGVWDAPGRALEVPGEHFGRFFRACALVIRKTS